MSDKSNFFEGFLFGAVVGVLGGLLFAPSTGEETRKKIKTIQDNHIPPETTENLVSKTLDAIDQGFEKLSHMVSENKTDTKSSTSQTSSTTKSSKKSTKWSATNKL